MTFDLANSVSPMEPWNRVEFDSRPVPAFCRVREGKRPLDEVEIEIEIRGEPNRLAVIRFINSLQGRPVSFQHPHFQLFRMDAVRLISMSPVVRGRDGMGEPCDVIIVEAVRA